MGRFYINYKINGGKKNSILALIIYFLLATILWGIPQKFDFVKSGIILGDPSFYLWCFKWWPYAISHRLNPFITKVMWAPFGQDLAWTTSIPSLAIVMWPITTLFGPVFSYNLITIISLTLSSFGIYLINKELNLKELSSFFGGLIFLFSPYIWGQLLGHVNLYVVFILIYLIYINILRFKKKLNKKTFLALNAFLLAFQFGISNEIYATYVFFGFTTLIISLIIYKGEKEVKNSIISLGIENLISISLSAILLLPYLYYIFKDYVKESINDNSVFVADPLNYFIPTPVTLLGSKKFLYIAKKFSGNFSEEGAYLGIPIILIILIFICEAFKDFKNKKFYFLLSLLFLVFVIFSFGPYLNILGHKTVPMPWYIFSHLPLIKQALPTRFTLYVDILVSIILSIWFDNQKNNYLKIVGSISAILFLLPNITIYKGQIIESFIPPFIKNSEYKKYISKGENIIVLPSYEVGCFQPPLWQYYTNFYFNLSQRLIWTPPPKQLKNLTDFFFEPGLNNYLNLYHFALYLEKCNVKHLMTSDKGIEKALDKYDLTTSKIVSGGVVLYKVDDSLIKNLKEASIKGNINLFKELFNSSYKFLKDGNSLDDLYPKYLEEHGYLDKSFGYEEGLAINWTKNGGWIGKWDCPDAKGKCFGVGLKGDIDTLKPIIDKYKDKALIIYFPYPTIYKENSKDKEGQLLIIFRAP